MSAAAEVERTRRLLREIVERLVPSMHDQLVIVSAASAWAKASANRASAIARGEEESDDAWVH